MSTTDSEQANPTYRIDAVSRLTGIAPDTLRVWERRYGAVVPFQSDSRTRLYEHLQTQPTPFNTLLCRVVGVSGDVYFEGLWSIVSPEKCLTLVRYQRIAASI